MRAIRGVEVVFHEGALPSVPRSVQDPLTTTAVNVEGTLNVLLAARDENVRRIVNASSSSVYGNSGELPRVESQAPDPISPYAVAKLAAERFCTSFCRVYGMEIVSLRYFNVFGPRQDPTSQYAAVVPRFIRAIADGRAGHDLRRRRAVARLHVRGQRRRREPPGRGCRRGQRRDPERRDGRLDDGQRARGLGRRARSAGTSRKSYEPAREADVHASWANSSEARRLLGYEPQVAFDEGLRRTADHLLDGKE